MRNQAGCRPKGNAQPQSDLTGASVATSGIERRGFEKEEHMQRHFSNRGEAVAEVTAARMLARRERAVMKPQGQREAALEKRFSQRITPRREKQQTNRKEPTGPSGSAIL